MHEKLKELFLDMKKQEAMDLVEKSLQSGVDPMAILNECRAAMDEVGKKFETGEFFLSELIYSAEIFKGVNSILRPSLSSSSLSKDSKGVVVFGTPKGDIHDLGKNIMIVMMESQGFTVHDLGVDVPPQKFIEKVKETKASILAFSSLITPSFASMKETVSLLVNEGLRKDTFVIMGGGVTTSLVREQVEADAQTLDPTEGIRLCKQFIQKKMPRN